MSRPVRTAGWLRRVRLVASVAALTIVTPALAHAQSLALEVEIVTTTHPLDYWNSEWGMPMWVLTGNRLDPPVFEVKVTVYPREKEDAEVKIEVLDAAGNPVPLISPFTQRPVEGEWTFHMDQNPDFVRAEWRSRRPDPRAGEILRVRFRLIEGDEEEEAEDWFILVRRGAQSAGP